jgi:hypothetical protein
MKIVCMDCQTETHIEVEQLKDKQSIKCETCAENPLASATNLTIEGIRPSMDETLDFYSVSVIESPSDSKDLELFTDSKELELFKDEVLEIPPLPALSENTQSPEMDEIISVPFYDIKSDASIDDSNVVSVDEHLQASEKTAVESPRPLASETVPAVVAPPQIPEASDFRQPAELVSPELPAMPKGLKVLTVKTPILMGAAAVLVLFIALGDQIIRPASKASVETETSRPVIAPERDVKPSPPVITSAQPAPAEPLPTPTPQVVETKPVEVKPLAEQPATTVAAAPADGQFTIQVGSHNDQSKANEQANRLRVAGFDSRVVSVELPKRGRWYRVQSGGFSNRAEANRYGAQVLSKGIVETFVVVTP